MACDALLRIGYRMGGTTSDSKLRSRRDPQLSEVFGVMDEQIMSWRDIFEREADRLEPDGTLPNMQNATQDRNGCRDPAQNCAVT